MENKTFDTNNCDLLFDEVAHYVVEPTSGIYIVKQGNTVRKVVINK